MGTICARHAQSNDFSTTNRPTSRKEHQKADPNGKMRRLAVLQLLAAA